MKKIFIMLQLVVVAICSTQCDEEELTYTCEIDTDKTGYELAGEYDDCFVWNAQKKLAHIEPEDIDIRATELSLSEFGSSYADMNADENWIKPTYTIIPEDMSSYPGAPESINGVVLAKFKSKDKIDADFGFKNDEQQGICADVQQDVYDTVLYSILTDEQRTKYEEQGKPLYFIPDDDLPPLDDSTNPVVEGSSWLDVDPAEKMTREGDSFYYEPLSLFVEFDDPAYQNISERYRGVRYCKFLSHQALLGWMTEKSFEENPVLITPSIPECDEPSSTVSTAGSCLFYFLQAENYYCSDYTGSGFDAASAEAKCNSRPTNPHLNPIYSPASCSERTEEIEASIPGYLGLTGLCVIHCKTEQEFIWNIYTENPEDFCGNFDFFEPEEILESN